jgi:microcystin-dependent protein
LVGTTFGSVDGSTFNLPDLRGRVPFGLDNMGGTAANILQATTTISTSSGSPTATVAAATNIAPGMFIVSANVPAGTTVSAITGTTVTLSANATATASGTAARFSALSDAQAIGGTGGAQNHTLTTAEIPAHSHGITDPGHTHALNIRDNLSAVGSTPAHIVDNLVAGLTSASAVTGITINNAGGGGAHTILPPAMALPFILRVI